MLSVKEKGIMLYIIKHCYRVESKIDNVSYETFLANEDIKEIVCFNILQIGELVKNLSPEFLKQYSKIPWKDIKGMKDYLAHGYGTIDVKQIYNTATSDIKILRVYCEQIINKKNSH